MRGKRLVGVVAVVGALSLIGVAIAATMNSDPDASGSTTQVAGVTVTSGEGQVFAPELDTQWVDDLISRAEGWASVPTVSHDAVEADAVVRPGDSIQRAVNDLPEGATIVLATGVHVGQQVKPKDGMTFVGEPGAVMDGEGSTKYAFLAWPDEPIQDVTVSSIEIRNYVSVPAHGAIHAPGGMGWLVEDCEVHHNGGAGVNVADRSIVRRCHLHNNERIGLKARGADVLIEDNEISFNNPNDANDPTFEAGGMKFGGSDGVVIRNNHVHDNHGHGIWGDVGPIHTIYEGNLVENNTFSGINHEIGYEAVIRDNEIVNNGHGDDRSGLRGAGILIKGPNVEVYANRLEANRNGIGLIENDRGEGDHGPYTVTNVWIHDNTIIESGQSGAQRFKGSELLFDTTLFSGNEYRYQDPSSASWLWDEDVLDWDEWKDLGYDVEGSLAGS